MVPISWLTFNSNCLPVHRAIADSQSVAQSRTQVSPPKIITHPMPVSEPSDSGNVPASWLPFKNKKLQCQCSSSIAQHHHIAHRRVTAKKNTRGQPTSPLPVASPQASQCTERLWDGANKLVVVDE
jgi:hypothetical protein